MKYIKINFLIILLLSFGCGERNTIAPKIRNNKIDKENKVVKKIPVLNLGTFHFGYTPDANITEFDEHDIKNQEQAHQIAKKLAAFNPSVIIVESLPEYNEKLLADYYKYKTNPKIKFDNPSEIELLAYEVGRIAGVNRIYGIDHSMEYNYNIGNEITNKIDSVWYNKFNTDPLSFYPEVDVNENNLSLLDKLKLKNNPEYLDFLITVNADILTHAGSENSFEGADEATKFYQRNLRMYSNLNRIELFEKDRVFILMGAAHTAFFRDFIGRSPKYEMVNTFDYLN